MKASGKLDLNMWMNLIKMGANIKVEGSVATVDGVE